MKITYQLGEGGVLEELGKRLARRRLDLELTQAAAAEQAGVSKRTVERMEAGSTVQLSSFIRILRALDLLAQLDTLLPEPGPRPLDLLKLKGKIRQRAPSPDHVVDKNGETEWHWGEDA
ncbi:MAG: helix-turn-helix domain-containing protein [Gammaproteobacteria bacterium]|nr:helix-turn-helix domain-containing protein [Gammaproteobacteria bacterium]